MGKPNIFGRHTKNLSDRIIIISGRDGSLTNNNLLKYNNISLLFYKTLEDTISGMKYDTKFLKWWSLKYCIDLYKLSGNELLWYLDKSIVLS